MIWVKVVERSNRAGPLGSVVLPANREYYGVCRGGPVGMIFTRHRRPTVRLNGGATLS